MSAASVYRHPARSELRWAALFAAAFLVLTCVPYLIGLGLKPNAASYYSGFIANPDEHNVYLSLMRQAHDGHLFLRDMFTAEPQGGRVLNVFWFTLGLFARVTHLPLPIVYHLARVLSGWLLLMAIYCLAAQALSSLTARRAALVLAATASGLGWLYHAGPGQPNPIDFGSGLIMPEAITFLTLLLNPLFAFSVFLLVVIYLATAHAFASGSVRAAVLAGLAALVLGNIHTYDVIPVAVVLAVFLGYALIARGAGLRAAALALLIAAIAAPSLLYQLWLQRSGDISLLVKATNQPPSPEPIFVALGLGIPLLFAAIGLGVSLRGNDWSRLLALWLVLGAASVYAPVAFQRKLIEGLHIPIALLAMVAIERIVAGCRPRGEEELASVGAQQSGGAGSGARLRVLPGSLKADPPGLAAPSCGTAVPRRIALAAALLIVISLPSDFAFLGRSAVDVMSNNTSYLANLMPPLYLSQQERAALDYLGTHAGRSDVLLANSLLSNYAPSLAGVRVYFGHWSETPDFVGKLREFSWFLSDSTPDAAREAFVRAHGITYVLLDLTRFDSDTPAYDTLYVPPGPGLFRADRASWLEPVFEQDSELSQVAVYRVKSR